jgi:hypothetical protein
MLATITKAVAAFQQSAWMNIDIILAWLQQFMRHLQISASGTRWTEQLQRFFLPSLCPQRILGAPRVLDRAQIIN